MEHGSPLQRQGSRNEPGHQRRRPCGAQTHHRGLLAVGRILLNLMEMRAEQHQRGGQSGTRSQQ